MSIEQSAPQVREFEPFSHGIQTNVYFPQKVITNQDVEAWGVSDTDGSPLTASSILQKTGIERRYVAASHETTLDMADHAAGPLLSKDKKADVVLFSSSYPIGLNQAIEFTRRHALETEFVLEIGAACSGFTRGLAILKDNEDQMKGKRVLFVSSEKYSDSIVDLRQVPVRTTDQLLFSDGGAAVEFTYGEDLTVLSYVNKSIESDDIQMPIDEEKIVQPYLQEKVPKSPDYFRQNGRNVLKTVSKELPDLIDQAVRSAGVKPEDIKVVIPHQPSKHVLGALSKRSPYPFVVDFQSGNFSSASIPKALHRILSGKRVDIMRNGKIQEDGKSEEQLSIKKGDIVVLAGFGAGFYASVVVVKF